MISSQFAIVFVLFFFVAFKRLESAWQDRRFAAANGCKPVPKLQQPEYIIGIKNVIEGAKAWRTSRWLDMWRDRFSTIGTTFQISALGRTTIFTIDPENVKTILATKFEDFDVGERRARLFRPLIGSGIFTTDGKAWEHSRSLVRPVFTKALVSNFSKYETQFQALLEALPQPCPQTGLVEVDLQPLFARLTLDLATELLLGRSLCSLLASPGSTTAQFVDALDYAQGRIHIHGLWEQPFLRPFAWIYSILAGSLDAKFDEACTTVHEIMDKIIIENLGRLNQKPSHDRNQDDTGVSDKYIFLDEIIKATQDPLQLRYEILNMLLAGRDTTAGLLSNTFFILSRRPDIWARLQAEVKETFGDRMPEYDALRNMRYVRNLLNESLRLHPVIPFNSRVAVRNTTLPRGGGPDGKSPVFVKAGQPVNYHVWSMHRNAEHFGPNAELFDPDRWSNSNLRPGWAYIPFNRGPRVCVGQQFALTEAAYIVVRLVQEFDSIECRDEQWEWIANIGITTNSQRGARVALKTRIK
ncbi:cytochrome P450 [Biscogniauxia mediterranea]|nr:cytochrome P450 [Biscogniauxia mediterranea]